MDVAAILRKASRNWDGGYAIPGMMGHGDAFVMRDPSGIRPAYYYIDDEVVVVASRGLLFKQSLMSKQMM
jgi:amidophosphoribosyltransferase